MTTVTTPEPGIGVGTIHTLLPDVRVALDDLPEAGELSGADREFLATCGVATVGEFGPPGQLENGALAARACAGLREAGADPDVLLLATGRAPDVLLGSEPGRVQAESGLRSDLSLAVDGLGCTGSSAAWGLARDLLRTGTAGRSVAIAHASRPSGRHRVRPPVAVIGDGACAMSLVPGGRPVLRAHAVRTDGAFHDLFRISYRDGPWYEWRESCSSADRYRFELALASRRRLGALVDEVLGTVGAGRADVAGFLMQNVTASAFDFYETALGIPVDPVCSANLAAWGHLGAMDVVLNLQHALASGRYGPGDLLLVLNNSPAAAWAVTLWEV